MDWKDKTFLIAEDDEINYNLLKIILKQTGAKIIWAQNGLEALNIFGKENLIDLILMDIQMPIMDGHEASFKIRKIDKKVPIIVVSAYTTFEVRERAREVGTNDFINKPVQVNSLLDTISKYV